MKTDFSYKLLTLVLVGLSFCTPLPTACAAIGDQLFKLLPNDGAAEDLFGGAVAISGNRAIVGASWDDDNGDESGSAYLFDVITGMQTVKLTANDGLPQDGFGSSVGISGNAAVVGAPYADDNGSWSGSAYLFDVTTGNQTAKLLPNDGAANDWFGFSTGIGGGSAIVGAYSDEVGGVSTGSAYLFDIETGAQSAKLLPNDGEAGDQFGYAVAVDGNRAIVGAPHDDDNGSNSGSVYLYDTVTGSQVAKLTPDDAVMGEQFGSSVAIDGNRAIIGARFNSENGGFSGAAYLFDIQTGTQIAKLLPDDGEANDQFGLSVDISGNVAVVSTFNDRDFGSASGSAYLFSVATGNQIAKLLPSDGAANDRFGFSVGISEGTAIAGALNDDDNGNRSGSAYLFQAKGLDGDFDLDGDVDGFDFLVWQRDTSVGDLADWETNFGMTSAIVAAAETTSVPEPASVSLALFAIFFSIAAGRKRGSCIENSQR